MFKLGSHRELPALAVALLGTVFFAWLAVRDTFIDLLTDSAIYALLADYFSPYRATTHHFLEFLFGEYPFPPLYPVPLGFLGGGTAVPAVDYAIGALLLGLTLAVFLQWLARAGVPLTSAAGLVPPQACISAIMPQYVLPHMRHRSLRPAPPDRGTSALFKGLRDCPYVFMMAIETYPSNGYPMLYPFALIRDRFEVIAVTHQTPGDDTSDVLTMLAYVPEQASEEPRRPATMPEDR